MKVNIIRGVYYKWIFIDINRRGICCIYGIYLFRLKLENFFLVLR